jgi:uncharacterized protein DUF6457
VDGWIDELAAELGEDPLTPEEVGRLLGVARDVAHRVERKTTPLAAFVLGSAVGRAEASGMDRERAMQDVFGTLERLLPEPSPGADEPDPATPTEVAEAMGEAAPGPDAAAADDAAPDPTDAGGTLDG